MDEIKTYQHKVGEKLSRYFAGPSATTDSEK